MEEGICYNHEEKARAQGVGVWVQDPSVITLVLGYVRFKSYYHFVGFMRTDSSTHASFRSLFAACSRFGMNPNSILRPDIK